jgi:hypothetical protein
VDFTSAYIGFTVQHEIGLYLSSKISHSSQQIGEFRSFRNIFFEGINRMVCRGGVNLMSADVKKYRIAEILRIWIVCFGTLVFADLKIPDFGSTHHAKFRF